jgi:RND family efflux transporter MFP subunit
VITSRKAELGGTVFPGQPLFTIDDEGSYLLDLAIPESLASRARPGMPVKVNLDSSEGAFQGVIAEIVPAADPASRTFSARINLARKGLKSGMFGRGEIALGSLVNGIFVPVKAVVEHGALVSLWVVDKDRTARIRLIKPGKTVGDRVEILSGLSAGETVVIAGMDKLSEGAKVE